MNEVHWTPRKPARKKKRAGKILVPILDSQPGELLIPLAKTLSEGRQILVQGYVQVEPHQSLSQFAGAARNLRSLLRMECRKYEVRLLPKIVVSHHVASEITAFAAEEGISLVVVPFPDDQWEKGSQIRAALSYSTCDTTLLYGSQPPAGCRILVILRSGRDSELALRLALRLARSNSSSLTAMRPLGSAEDEDLTEATEGLAQVLEHLPEIEDTVLISDNPLKTILEQTKEFDAVIVGAAADDSHTEIFDDWTQCLIEKAGIPIIVARAHLDSPVALPEEISGAEAISILVDKWFAENTFHSDEFSDLHRLMKIKQDQGLAISLVLPALNEEQTLANVILTLRTALLDEVPLLDEILLVDSNSTDRTREIARELGIPVYVHQQVLTEYGSRQGKGEALWKSLYLTRGDIILWVDTDIVNIHPRFVFGLIGPLLHRPDLMFIKGFYLRPIKVGEKIQAGGGGRVTELTARPMLNLFYPALSGFVQPLSGEYGGRRKALEQIPFSTGYGVEIGMLIDILEHFGLDAMGQVDMMRRIHHNQPLEALSKMSFAIIQTLIRKLDARDELSLLKDINRTMKIVSREKKRFFLDVEEIAEHERPPIITLPEYRQIFTPQP